MIFSRRWQELEKAIVKKDTVMIGDKTMLPVPFEMLESMTSESDTVISYKTNHIYEEFAFTHRAKKYVLRRRIKDAPSDTYREVLFYNNILNKRDFKIMRNFGKDASKVSFLGDTIFASFRDGMILYPMTRHTEIVKYTPEIFQKVFAVIEELEISGLFEWDFSREKLLFDGETVLLNDHSTMFKYDPKTERSSRRNTPDYIYGAERFETRHFFDYLVVNPDGLSEDEKMSLYKIEKEQLLKHFESKYARLQKMKARHTIINWNLNRIEKLRRMLASDLMLERTYIAEMFRSLSLELNCKLPDDVNRKNRKIKSAEILKYIEYMYDDLVAMNTIIEEDEGLTKAEMLDKYGKL